MTIKELAERLAQQSELHPQQVERLIRQALKSMLEEAMHSGRFLLLGVGTFYRHDSKARAGRNPRTGEPHEIHGRSQVRFRQAPATQVLHEETRTQTPSK